MGREEGGGFRMGNTCIPVADYVKFKNKIKFKILKKKNANYDTGSISFRVRNTGERARGIRALTSPPGNSATR